MDEVEALRERFVELVSLREQRDQTKKTAENAERAYRDYEAELWEDINDSPLKGAIRLEIPGHGDVVFQKKETYRGRVLDEAALIEWAEENGVLGAFTKPSISKARLNELVRQKIEAREAPPDGADFTATRYISISYRGDK